MTRRTLIFALLSMVPLIPASAQAPATQTELSRIAVRTYPLQNLSPEDAAKLVGPYASGPGTGVFDAGGAVRAITVRATPDVLVRVDSLLRANDRARATVRFRFQLIAASDSAGRDPAIGAVETELRSLFRFAGYSLLAQGMVVATERNGFALTLGGSASGRYEIGGQVLSVQGATGREGGGGRAEPAGGVRIEVNVSEIVAAWIGPEGNAGASRTSILSTGLTVPFGQTVVLGTGAGRRKGSALILTVLPELVPPARP